MMRIVIPYCVVTGAILLVPGSASALETFDTDPGWEAVNNRPGPDAGVMREQSFGYSATQFAGGETGEIGGRVDRTFTPARYATPVPTRSLQDRLEASGRFAVTQSDGGGVLIGWFNEDSRGWRTPNSLVFRIDGSGGKYRVFFEYGTQHWKTGGGETFEGPYQTTKTPMHPADGTVHDWKFVYDPAGEAGNGVLQFTLDGTTYSARMAPGHKADGATFNRFGILNQQVPGGTVTVYLDDLMVDGVRQPFDHDPAWEAIGNRESFLDTLVRPIHDFGFSPTSHAGGAPGEIGGAIWRIESMEPDQSAYYAVPVSRLTLNDTLHAAGKVAMTAAAADSGVLIGWFNEATHHGAPPMNFLGVFVEGPSRIGHYFRPVFGTSDDLKAAMNDGPVLYADSVPRTWTLDYNPEASRIEVTLDGQSIALDVPPEARKGNAIFNRFGMLSWLRGGHFVMLYLDDLAFTGE
jgi:hypothetical protein